MTWQEFERAAPALAAAGRALFERFGVVLIATIRRDGSPRISPIEPYLLSGQLVLGVMRSDKLRDLERDPRCTIHSAVTNVNGSDGEFKLHGRAVAVADAGLSAAWQGWWTSRSSDSYRLFAVDIQSATALQWETDTGQMHVTRWSTSEGLHETTRPYP